MEMRNSPVSIVQECLVYWTKNGQKYNSIEMFEMLHEILASVLDFITESCRVARAFVKFTHHMCDNFIIQINFD